jgi:tetratricopeptide (TPR) repeat protein
MTTNEPLWISRKIADEIHERIITDDGSAAVYVVEAEAGMGKTFMARDIGARLGSATGREPVRLGRIAWSGILDVYDPDTNSNQGIERRLIQAFSVTGAEFDDYNLAREMYDAYFKTGIVGSNLEEQRHKVEDAFAQGLKGLSVSCRLVLVFDTIERLETASDLTQKELGFSDDTASVIGWLLFQICQLRSGVVLLFGRRSQRFLQTLQKALRQANAERHGLAPIELRHIELSDLDSDELSAFLNNRMARYPQLKRVLDDDLWRMIAEQTGGNPLLLDLALQVLMETAKPDYVRQALAGVDSLPILERALVHSYMNSLDTDRQALFLYLALARNGLFAELLEALEPAQRAERLVARLDDMESLPFVKVRDIAMASRGREQLSIRRTFFLHDAMYVICDQVLFGPEQVRQDSERILSWYDKQLKAETQEGTQHSISKPDLVVDSLFYRMRSDPLKGYQWYLQQADRAIRDAATGLDMRLRDAMALFLTSASSCGTAEPEQTLTSPIDRANIAALMPELFNDFGLDSAILWMRRYTLRGKLDQAKEIGTRMLSYAEGAVAKNAHRYTLPFAEFLLWYGQVLMYGFDIKQALLAYQRVLSLLETVYSINTIANPQTQALLGGFGLWRLCLVLGRTYNNLGYTHWLYEGRYSLAIREFKQAIRFFRIAQLDEEVANSSDNMGRVYALLGREFQANQLIRNGMEIRASLGLAFREALSANSLAQALSRFGQLDAALRAADNALALFGRVGVERGIGLGRLTRGTVYRSLAEMWRELDISVEKALSYTDLAETDLRDAVHIFSVLVKEPIREIQARNEMGCCYRARYLIATHLGTNEVLKDMALSQARLNLRATIDLAEQHGYYVEQLDSVQDLAVLLTRAKRYDEAERLLEEIRLKIPQSHQIQEGVGLPDLNEAERVDAYYKLMGQVELLQGAIEFERRWTVSQGEEGLRELQSKRQLLATMRHYVLSVSYFRQYAEEPFAHRLTYSRIHRRFRDCSPDLIRELAQLLPTWIKQYGLSSEPVHGLFEDVFGLFD